MTRTVHPNLNPDLRISNIFSLYSGSIAPLFASNSCSLEIGVFWTGWYLSAIPLSELFSESSLYSKVWKLHDYCMTCTLQKPSLHSILPDFGVLLIVVPPEPRPRHNLLEDPPLVYYVGSSSIINFNKFVKAMESRSFLVNVHYHTND